MLTETEQAVILSYYRHRVSELEHVNDRLNNRMVDMEAATVALQKQLDNLTGVTSYAQLIKDPGACDRVKAIIRDMQQLHGTDSNRARISWKIESIKKVREIFHVGLKEAKEWVEAQVVAQV